MASPDVFYAHPQMAVPIRRIPCHSYKIGTEYVIDLEVVSRFPQATVNLACSQAGWFEVSSDGGSNYYTLPESVQTGFVIGPMTAGQRKAIKIMVKIPGAAKVRHRLIELKIGLGT